MADSPTDVPSKIPSQFACTRVHQEGTTTTPFDMVVLNRNGSFFSLVNDAIDRVPQLAERAAYAKQAIRDKLIDHREYICRYGDDISHFWI